MSVRKNVIPCMTAENYVYAPARFEELKDDINRLRLEEIEKRHSEGLTLSEIAEIFGISRQRVHQILKKEGKTKIYRKRTKKKRRA